MWKTMIVAYSRHCMGPMAVPPHRAFLWETYGRKVRAVPECMQCTRVHLYNALGWLAGARAGGFQPVIQWSTVVNHARAAFSL